MREKLIDLYREAHKKAHEHCNNVRCDKCEYEHFGSNCIRIAKADHLIANGVTIPVRCKDCRFFYRHTQINTELGDCWKYGIGSLRNKKLDDFCSYGERKDNG